MMTMIKVRRGGRVINMIFLMALKSVKCHIALTLQIRPMWLT